MADIIGIHDKEAERLARREFPIAADARAFLTRSARLLLLARNAFFH